MLVMHHHYRDEWIIYTLLLYRSMYYEYITILEIITEVHTLFYRDGWIINALLKKGWIHYEYDTY